MITIRKLQSLPPDTRRRKSARLLESVVAGRLSPDECWLRGLLNVVQADEGLAGRARDAAGAAIAVLDATAGGSGSAGGDASARRRALDDLRHRLLAHLAMEPADWDLLPPAGHVAADHRSPDRPPLLSVALYLESIRSPFNLGSIVRTAVALGVETIGMSEECPALDHRRVVRSAMGAIERARIVRGSLDELLATFGEGPRTAAAGETVRFQADRIIALELGGEPVSSIRFPEQGVLLVGSEELGLSPRLLARAGRRVSIPMAGPKASLNVGVACGIALAAWAAGSATR